MILEFKIDGVILTNTTEKNRDTLVDEKKNEIGGLSGQPLQDLSTEFVKKFYKELKGQIPIVGVGGIDSGESAFEKFAAGASAVQLYTGLIYKGPTIIKDASELRVKETDRLFAMAEFLKSSNIKHNLFDDGIEILGDSDFSGGNFNSFNDHRIAMSIAISSLISDRETIINNSDVAAVSYKQFWDHLEILKLDN